MVKKSWSTLELSTGFEIEQMGDGREQQQNYFYSQPMAMVPPVPVMESSERQVPTGPDPIHHNVHPPCFSKFSSSSSP